MPLLPPCRTHPACTLRLLCAAAQPTAADPLKFIEVRRCYDIHRLLRALDELLAHQAQQAQQAQQEVGLTVQQQDVQLQQHVQQQEGMQQQQQQAAPTSAGATAAGGLRRRLEDLPVQLLIVDSLSALIAPVLGGGAGQHSQGHALLAAAATNLKAFAAGPGLPGARVATAAIGVGMCCDSGLPRLRLSLTSQCPWLYPWSLHLQTNTCLPCVCFRLQWCC